jgi:hypothetical protein
MDADKRTRGLPAVDLERQKRKGFPRIPPRLWLWVFIVLAVWAIIYWKVTQGRVESARSRLLARQRAVAAELGPRLGPLRDKLEAWVAEAAGPFAGDWVGPEAKPSGFRAKPGVYLRVLLEDARDPRAFRRAVQSSLRDGFTACFTTAKNPDPTVGPPCKLNHECPPGQHCNETDHCSVPAQPFNARVAYRATRVLGEDWVTEVREAGDDMRLRLLERDFDSAVKQDVPLAIDLMMRAQYFLLVVDEPAADRASVPDAGSALESLQLVAHPARVFLWDLAQNKPMLRARAEAIGEAGAVATDPTTLLSVRRQANNCALAMVIRRMLDDE